VVVPSPGDPLQDERDQDRAPISRALAGADQSYFWLLSLKSLLISTFLQLGGVPK
jgi:hypothetical protein